MYFYDKEVSPILEYGLALALKSCRKPAIVDLGCGDGRIIFALHKKGALRNVGEIIGVDISKARIERFKTNLPFVRGIVSDASNVKDLLSHSFDFVICSQLIEHVEGDDALMLEIKRLLKNGGIAYLSISHNFFLLCFLSICCGRSAQGFENGEGLQIQHKAGRHLTWKNSGGKNFSEILLSP